MTSQRIRVGVIGANAERSWAAKSHLPALRALPEFELAAVCTTRGGVGPAVGGAVRRSRVLRRPQDDAGTGRPRRRRGVGQGAGPPPPHDGCAGGGQARLHRVAPGRQSPGGAGDDRPCPRQGRADDGRSAGAVDADLPATEGAGRRRVRRRGAVVQHELVPVRRPGRGAVVVVAGGQSVGRERLHGGLRPPHRRPLHGPGRVHGGVHGRRDHRRPLGGPGLRPHDRRHRRGQRARLRTARQRRRDVGARGERTGPRQRVPGRDLRTRRHAPARRLRDELAGHPPPARRQARRRGDDGDRRAGQADLGAGGRGPRSGVPRSADVAQVRPGHPGRRGAGAGLRDRADEAPAHGRGRARVPPETGEMQRL